MDSEQPIHIKTPACYGAGDGEDNDEMKEMLGITNVSICLCPGAAWGAWNMHP